MRITRWMLGAAVALAAVLPGRLSAQGVTTGAVSGTVTNEQGQPLESVQIQVRNTSTGATAGTLTRGDGRYFVQGLEVGGPYTVTARRIGFAPQQRAQLSISLGQNARADFVLAAQAAQLSGVTVTAATENALISSARKGTQTTISDSSVSRLPTLNRNFTDFVALTPQISTKGPGNSAGGQNNRYNAIQIDGSVANDLFGLGSTGQPGGQAGAKQVPLAAVKEYQVLLSPYDVRQGNFTGALINAVTRSGSNEFHGEVFGVTRNEKLQRDVAFLRDAPFKQSQYGFWVGGPIIRDRLQFSIAPEFQTQNTPASGPYVGQPSNLTQIVPVDTANQNRFCRILVNQYGYSSCGNFGLVTNDNPLSNLFARFDVLNLPGNSRAVVRYNFAGAEQNSFSRSQFVLRDATNGFNFTTKTNSGLAQLFTNLANGSSNEFLIGYTTIRDQRATDINAPQVTVRVPFAGGTGTASLVAGTENSSQGNALDQDIFEITNNFTFPVGTHRFTIGTKNEFFKVRNVFSQNSLGNYFFNSLDSLELGRPNNATLGIKVNPADPSDGAARFNARTLGFYAMDEWQATPNLSLQYGLRADLPGLTSQPGTNPLLRDSLGINTSNVPKNVLQWSPRFGFNWDVTGNQVNQLRGGAGVFVGRPAYVWLSNLFGNSGVSGYGNVVCSNPNTAPRFPGANSALPTNCNNSTGAPSIVLNTVDPDLKFPQIMRASLGFDRRLPGDFIATVEGLYTKAIQNFFYNNLGLAEPPATRVDRHGRLLYGDVVGTNIVTNYKPGLSDVINLTNQSKDYSYSMTGQLQKRFSNNFEGQVAYTFGHSYDVASLTSSVAASNFAFGRSVKGNLNDTELSISKFDSPHRIIAHGTYSFPSKTDVSVIFSGESGTPFDFVYSGDMNGDRQTSNDLIYVPRDARDPNEIQFTTAGGGAPIAQQQAAFEAFIAANECLDSQRGTIMNRNTCRTPWGRRLDVDIRQALPTFRGQNFLVQLDIFNFLNLLNRNWGAQDLGSSNSPTILTRQSFTPGTLANGAQGLYRFNPTFSQFNTQNASSNYSLQMQLKYTF